MVMADVQHPSMLVAMLPKTGGLHLGWEKKPSTQVVISK
jgi:hypothetical protein